MGLLGNFGAQLGYLGASQTDLEIEANRWLDDFTMRFEANPDDRTRITTNISWYDETTQTLEASRPRNTETIVRLAGKPNDEFKGRRGRST